ncbi:MAG: tetratricopeptide repeat protein [Cyanobacteria bacterium SZAS TMP-1]|nr:tetratricopeptide repeat protein [Cyanobacteria bacterium SZAS TMP-1]
MRTSKTGIFRISVLPAVSIVLSCTAAQAGDFGKLTNIQLEDMAKKEWSHRRCPKAMALCDELIRRNPKNPFPYITRAACIDFTVGPREAAAELSRYLRTHPADYETIVDLGAYYASDGQHQKAVATFSEAIKLLPTNPEAYHQRSIAYGSLKQYEKAIDDLTAYIKLSPNSRRGYQWRASAYQQTGQWNKAIEDLNRAMQASPRDSSEFIIQRADLYAKIKEYKKAIADYDTVLKLNSLDDTLWFKKGQALMNLKEYKKAIEAFTETIELNESSTAYYARSEAYEKLNNHAAAVKDKAAGDEQKNKRAIERL